MTRSKDPPPGIELINPPVRGAVGADASQSSSRVCSAISRRTFSIPPPPPPFELGHKSRYTLPFVILFGTIRSVLFGIRYPKLMLL